MTIDRAVIVGAGMVGLSTAFHLQERGVQVTVLDRDDVAAGSSWGNAGWIAPALTLPLPEPGVLAFGLKAVVDPASPLYIPFVLDLRLIRFLIGFARHCTPARWRSSMRVYAEVAGMALGAFEELRAGGVAEPDRLADPFLACFATPGERDRLLEELRGVVEAGGSVDYDLVDGEELRGIEPVIGAAAGVGIRLRHQHYIDPPRYVAALAETVRLRGGTIVPGAEVREVRDLGTAGVRIGCASGEPVHADAVVLANGAWLGSLARPFGVRQLVQAGRGYSFSVLPERMPQHPIYFPAQRIACTPLGDRFRISGMMEFRPAGAPLDPRRIEAIVNAARPLLSGIAWEDRREEWVGSRPCTPDGLPLIGATRSPRVFVAGGHGMWGITLGPLTGRLLAGAMLGDRGPEVLRSFDPLR